MTGRRPGEPIDVPSRGRATPPDITAIRVTDDLVEALSTQRCAPTAAPAEDDPAVRLLESLIADVDQGAPPLPAGRPAAPGRGSGRRGARTVVVLGVTTALLATTGVAAAGNSGLGGSLLRSAIVAKQVSALQPRAELKNVCQAVIEGLYGTGRGTRNRFAAARTGSRGALSVSPAGRSAGAVDRLGRRPLRERASGVRALLRQGWNDQAGGWIGDDLAMGGRTVAVQTVGGRTVGAQTLGAQTAGDGIAGDGIAGDGIAGDRTGADRTGADRTGTRIWRLRQGTQGFARPSSLSITPST